MKLANQHRLFVPSELNETPAFADIFAGWNAEGFGLKVCVHGKPEAASGDSKDLSISDAVLVWLDTRPTGDVHRATEYCHHFAVLPADRQAKGKPSISQQPIAQQRSTRIEFSAKQMSLQSKTTKTGYELEVWIPTTQLHGFREVSDIGRLGFHCVVKDGHLGDQAFHLSGDFPTGYDPSTWITLELQQ
ncbi:MAG: hypothetical protein ABJZ55_24505 [Fuerstiella sp.]